ncbi:NAC domain-containing protein 78 [Phtheirospermum japonicum]|uniref:NAC domain-containing protein 78 n=1 Tax=Phtheirospermum japonicum TaxID=374723 RepID=A0A830CWQ2_9LAMI|nr:NAC domain-containing protein 78 [Phtheirospermum japonicum]
MESKSGKKRSSISATMLGPGFRFHPTDEELVRYYLRRKVFGKALRFDAISEIDIYKAEPWDLPYMSRLKTRDLEWYFFSLLDKKYGNGARTNRATEKGYWKTTGKDRAVYHKTQIVGMKKTLVYHSGRAPKGQRSNWVMHEYKLADSELENVGNAQDAFVLCRVFQKSGTGPKNGEKYGAPFVEEDWDEELELSPKDDAIEELDFGLDSHDIQQILGSDAPLNAVPIPQYADGSYVEETTESFDSNLNLSAHAGYQCCEPKQYDDNNTSFPGNSEVVDYLLDEPFLESLGNLQDGDANDFSNPTVTDTTAVDMLEEYLTFFDASDDPSLYFAQDPAMMFGSEDLVSDQVFLPQKDMVEGTRSAILPAGQLIDNNYKFAASSSDKKEKAKYHPGEISRGLFMQQVGGYRLNPPPFSGDFEHSFVKQASQMLGGIQAPPALAAEFPGKDAVLRLNSVLSNSGSVIQVRNSKVVGDGTEVRAPRKHGDFNIVVCFGFSRGDDGSSSLESSVSLLPGKTVASTVSRCWLCFMFFWVLILSMSVRIGTYTYGN